MAWPLSQDYNEALQNPQTSFSDPELRQGEVVTNALGIPKPFSGNFADVYAVECAASKTKWAVKCFTREVRGLRERYSAISSYLQQAHLPFTVDFQYLEQGVRIAGKWYPILKMHWVEGFTLNAFVRDNLDKPALLEGLSRIWLKMAGRLREANLAHCDLQHGNVLLVPYTDHSLLIKLIDYDGMWVPALAQTPSGELGHAAYQHPQRLRDGVYNREVDRFPLLTIYLALRALMVGGRPLWERYDNGDNMLFCQQDFEAPARSPLFAELLRMNQPDVRDLAAKLIDAARKPLDQVTHLTELVPVDAPPPPASRSSAPARRDSVTVAAAPSVFSTSALEIPSGDGGRRKQKKGNRGFGWIAGAAATGIAVVLGGVLIWAMSSKSPPEKNPYKPEQQHARVKGVEPTREPKGKSNPPQEDNTIPTPEVKQTPIREEKKSPPSAHTSPAADSITIQLKLASAKNTYTKAVEKAKTALLRRFEELLRPLVTGGNTVATARLREEMKLFESQGMLFGTWPELKEAMLEYGRSLKSAKEALALSYHESIDEYGKLQKTALAVQLKTESDRLALDAPLVSVQGYARNTYIQHANYLGWLKPVNSDWERLNSTFELTPGMADMNGVSFRSVNVPNHFLVHGDFRLRLQPVEDSVGFHQNGTFRRVKGLGAAAASSFESFNYPGHHIRAKGNALFIEKYDRTPQFRLDATFNVGKPQFQLW